MHDVAFLRVLRGAMLTCRAELRRLGDENAAMRKELQAVDPEFFDQIEDLKHSHHQLKQKYASQCANLRRSLQV